MCLKEIGWKAWDWIHMDQYRDKWQAVVNTVTNFQVLWISGKFLTSWAAISYSRRTLLQAVSRMVRLLVISLHSPWRRPSTKALTCLQLGRLN
jgi:hypothetical protein